MEDLQAQYDFLDDIRTNLNTINETILAIRDSRKKLSGLLSLVDDSTTKVLVNEYISKGKRIEETLYQTKNRSPQDPLNFPIRLNNKYGHLGSLANFGFNRPTKQMYDVKSDLEGQIFEQFEAWEKLREEILGLNDVLREREVPYIELED
jgi:hypothetical protein